VAFPSLEDTVKSSRLAARAVCFPILTLALVAGLAASLTGPARADEQRAARLGLAISGMVTSLNPKSVNDGIDMVNSMPPHPLVVDLGKIHAAAFFQAEGRFFVSDKIVAVVGVGKIRKTSQVLVTPTGQSILQQARISGIPRHVGLDYYFTPYTRGDFTVRPFVGGGFMDVTEARAKVGLETTQGGVVTGGFVRARGEGPGFYAEAGTHLMLPGRYSFIINAHYRHVKASNLRYEDAHGVVGDRVFKADGTPENLDFSGFGLRLAVNINIWNKF
jgi:hypothetical protein